MPYAWSTATPESQSLRSEGLDCLLDLVQDRKSGAGRESSAAALVVVRNSKLVYERYWGTLSHEIDTPVDQDSVFCIFSGTKTFTQVMIGHLIDQGYIGGLDDKVSTYLGSDLGSHQWKDEITLDHLRHHRAGYDGQATSPYPWKWQWARDHPLVYRPGSRFIYSSVGSNVNGEVVRRALPGRPRYQGALREQLLAPLGMDHTRYLSEGDDLSNVVRRVGSTWADNNSKGALNFVERGGSNMGCGFLFSSARDYARLGLMLANGGGEILSADRFREIYPSPINTMLVTGLMECQCHVLSDLGLVMVVMVNSCADEDRWMPGTHNHNECRSALLKAVTDVPSFQESGGRVCMQAENFTLNNADYKWGLGHIWHVIRDGSASSGQAVVALPEDGIGNADSISIRTELVYLVRFSDPGQYRVWLRGRTAGRDKAVTIDMDGQKFTTAHAISWPEGETSGWVWTQHCADGTLATLRVPEPGVYNIQLLMYHDGVYIDKIYLTQDDETPEGPGPDESDRA